MKQGSVSVTASVLVAMALGMPATAMADSEYDSLKKQVELLQQQLQSVQKTLEQYEEKAASKSEVESVKKELAQISEQGEGQGVDSVVHLAGYGDVTYTDSVGNDNNGGFTSARFNPIFHYLYKHLVMFESEMEVEVGEDGGTEVALEYVTLDLLINDYVALVAGKFMSPIGQFRQNLHPSWINKLPTAPIGFGHDQAAPLSEMGVQARGGFGIGSMFSNYAVYVSNGPILEINGGEIEAIEAVGRTSNEDGKFVGGGRFAVLPIPMLELGFSAATGQVAGADEPNATRDYDVIGADAAYKVGGLGLRGEYLQQKVGSTSRSSAPESATWKAWYMQGSYRIPSTNWEGVVRYADYDTPHDNLDQKQWALGINYFFSSSAVAKIGYNFNDGQAGQKSDDDNFQLQFAYGF